MIRARALLLAALLAAPATLAAQSDVRARLTARGLPEDLVNQVTAVAAEATAQGLPAAPLADKAIEGYAKHVPAERIVAVVRQFTARMGQARGAVTAAGVRAPSGEVIAAAAEAMGRGLEAQQIGRVVRSARAPALTAPGLTVAAALVAQGMSAPRAVDVVAEALRSGRGANDILDLPSVARALESNGLSPDDAGQRILHGGEGVSGGPGRDGGHVESPGDGGGGKGGRGPGGSSGPTPQRPPDGRDGRGPGGSSGDGSGPGG